MTKFMEIPKIIYTGLQILENVFMKGACQVGENIFVTYFKEIDGERLLEDIYHSQSSP